MGGHLGAAEPGRRDRRRRLRQDHADGRAGRLPRGDRPGPARRGARPDLHDQGGRASCGTGSATRCAPPARSRRSTSEGEDVLEPTVATYNAYAAGLLTDHGLRIGHEPDTRVITDAARYQLGARAVDRFTGEVRHLTDHPATAIQNLLALDSAMSEHLVGPGRRARPRRRRPRPVRAGARRGGRRQEPHHLPRAASRRRSSPSTGAPSCSAWSTPTGGSSATSG